MAQTAAPPLLPVFRSRLQGDLLALVRPLGRNQVSDFDQLGERQVGWVEVGSVRLPGNEQNIVETELREIFQASTSFSFVAHDIYGLIVGQWLARGRQVN